MTVLFRGPCPGYSYHVMRCAAERFGRNVSELDEEELSAAKAQADRTYALESLVFSSDEARRVSVDSEQVKSALTSLVSRYPSRTEFASGLEANGLDESELREALRRELWFDRIMDIVAANRPVVSQEDARCYYDAHIERFVKPERRRAKHILVTIQDTIAENRPDSARNRIDGLADQLRSDPSRFAELAQRFSECPSALNGGSLGDIARGQLYPALDRALFQMREGTLSDVLETELGYHLLWFEKCITSRVLPFPAVELEIRSALDQRQQRKLQRAFLARLEMERVDP